jgi:quinol monooxygenase YgiN
MGRLRPNARENGGAGWLPVPALSICRPVIKRAFLALRQCYLRNRRRWIHGVSMQTMRRTLVTAMALLPLAACQSTPPSLKEQTPMYGLIGKIKVQPGQRDALASILLQATQGMPGCLSYVVATDPADGDALWITEVWESAALHKASLDLPAVKAALLAGRPLVAGFGERFETHPVGGFGTRLTRAD